MGAEEASLRGKSQWSVLSYIRDRQQLYAAGIFLAVIAAYVVKTGVSGYDAVEITLYDRFVPFSAHEALPMYNQEFAAALAGDNISPCDASWNPVNLQPTNTGVEPRPQNASWVVVPQTRAYTKGVDGRKVYLDRDDPSVNVIVSNTAIIACLVVFICYAWYRKTVFSMADARFRRKHDDNAAVRIPNPEREKERDTETVNHSIDKYSFTHTPLRVLDIVSELPLLVFTCIAIAGMFAYRKYDVASLTSHDESMPPFLLGCIAVSVVWVVFKMHIYLAWYEMNYLVAHVDKTQSPQTRSSRRSGTAYFTGKNIGSEMQILLMKARNLVEKPFVGIIVWIITAVFVVAAVRICGYTTLYYCSDVVRSECLDIPSTVESPANTTVFYLCDTTTPAGPRSDMLLFQHTQNSGVECDTCIRPQPTHVFLPWTPPSTLGKIIMYSVLFGYILIQISLYVHEAITRRCTVFSSQARAQIAAQIKMHDNENARCLKRLLHYSTPYSTVSIVFCVFAVLIYGWIVAYSIMLLSIPSIYAVGGAWALGIMFISLGIIAFLDWSSYAYFGTKLSRPRDTLHFPMDDDTKSYNNSCCGYIRVIDPVSMLIRKAYPYVNAKVKSA